MSASLQSGAQGRGVRRRSSVRKVAGHVAGNFVSKSLCRHRFCDARFQLTATPHSHSDFAVKKAAGKRSLDARANAPAGYGQKLGGQPFKSSPSNGTTPSTGSSGGWHPLKETRTHPFAKLMVAGAGLVTIRSPAHGFDARSAHTQVFWRFLPMQRTQCAKWCAPRCCFSCFGHARAHNVGDSVRGLGTFRVFGSLRAHNSPYPETACMARAGPEWFT